MMSVRKEWTEKELATMRLAVNESWSFSKLRTSLPDRGEDSVKNKLRKLKKSIGVNGEQYLSEKLQFTEMLAHRIKPNSVFEGYAGTGHQTLIWSQVAKLTISCERNRERFDLLIQRLEHAGFCKTLAEGNKITLNKGGSKIICINGDVITGAAIGRMVQKKFDLIDVDPYGTTLPILPSLIVLLSPEHLVITHGEFQLLRFKRWHALARILADLTWLNGSPDETKIAGFTEKLHDTVKWSCENIISNERPYGLNADLMEERIFGQIRRYSGILRRYYRLYRRLG